MIEDKMGWEQRREVWRENKLKWIKKELGKYFFRIKIIIILYKIIEIM